MSATTPPTDSLDDSTSLLSRRPYVLFLAGRFLGTLATGSQSVVIAWEVYELARQTMSLEEAAFSVGMIGLAQFLPLFALTLVAGETADRHDRRRILAFCYMAQVLISVGLAFRSAVGGGLWPIFALGRAVRLCQGVLSADRECSRARCWCRFDCFLGRSRRIRWPSNWPASSAPRLVGCSASRHRRLATRSVPGCTRPPRACAWLIRADTRAPIDATRSRVAQIREGLVYLWGNTLVLGAISLDLFAVLLGGATGLLPGVRQGCARGRPARVRHPARVAGGRGTFDGIVSGVPADPHTHAGLKMFLAVGLFGMMTVVFAFSRSLPLSVFALAVLGGADMVSMFTRQSLVQITTPDRMRGRVSAVSTLFIGASNELGEFESGVAARILGPVASVAFGGDRGDGRDSALGLAVPQAAEGGSVGLRAGRWPQLISCGIDKVKMHTRENHHAKNEDGRCA